MIKPISLAKKKGNENMSQSQGMIIAMGSFNDLKGRTRKISGQISLENAKQTQTEKKRSEKRKKPKQKQSSAHNNKCSHASFWGL